MSFIRAKTINGKKYYYLVENHRVDGKVHQRVLKYLGTKPNLGTTKPVFSAKPSSSAPDRLQKRLTELLQSVLRIRRENADELSAANWQPYGWKVGQFVDLIEFIEIELDKIMRLRFERLEVAKSLKALRKEIVRVRRENKCERGRRRRNSLEQNLQQLTALADFVQTELGQIIDH